MQGTSRTRPRWMRRSTAAVAVAVGVVAAACVPPAPTTPSTTTVVEAVEVAGAQLVWSYSQYAQYGVFGQWCQTASGPNVTVNTVDGETATGLSAEAGVRYSVVQFDQGTGSIDPDTGAGSIAWETGDWTLNAYCGEYGAPDETISDPRLDIEPDGSGQLSVEATIPAALDMNGNPAPAAGPTRITIATFDQVELGEDGLRAVPDFAGRSYEHEGASPWLACEEDGVATGGAWPTEWIDFVPASVRGHYYTTSCSGLNLRKAAEPLLVDWGTSPAAITLQPTLTSTTMLADAKPFTLGARVGVSGTPTPAIQWQRSFDGTTWTDVDGATNSLFDVQVGLSDGAVFRAVVDDGQGMPATSEVIGPVTVTSVPTSASNVNPAAPIVGRGDRVRFDSFVQGAPTPAITWERSNDGGTTWFEVAESARDLNSGSALTTLVIGAAEQSDHGAMFRVRASNGLNGEIVTAPATLTVLFEAPVITSQPVDRISFVGQPAVFSANVTARPAATYQWETSSDDGATWTDWVSTTSPGNAAGLTIAGADVTMDLDGDLFRVRVQSAAGSLVSESARLGVHPVTAERQVVVVPDEIVDPTRPVSLQVIGVGFSPPEGLNSAMRIVVTDTTRWQPGATANTTGALASSLTSAGGLRAAGGRFHTRITVPANSFADLDYGVATFGAAAAERFYDSWTPLTVGAP